jgi:ABC-type lipoprotein release transport system permease subunit
MWIEKQGNIIDFTLSSLLRRKRKNLALISVYTLVIFLFASILFFTHAIKKEASLLLKDSPEMIVQKMAGGRHELIPLGYIEQIKEIRGAHSVKGRLWGYYYDPVAGANFTLMVPGEGEVEQGGIAVGKGVSRVRFLDEEDEMEFMASDGEVFGLKVKQIFSPESELVSSDLILISEEDFRKLFGMAKGVATDIVLSVRNPKELSTIALKIAERLPDTRIILREEMLRTYEMVFNWRGGMMLVVLSGTLLAFIIFSWDRASGLSAEERREIGILKAIGWETSDVILMKFWEGTVISVSSFFVGVFLAYLHVFFLSSPLFEPALKGWAILYPKFKLIPFIDFYQIATLFFFTVVPYTGATIIPSWRAATIDPDSVMRT